MKRLLSIILAIAMCLSVIPAASASETEDTRETITLDLHQNNLSEKDVGALTHNTTEATAAGQKGKNNSAKIADLVVTDGAYEWIVDKSVADNEVYTASNSHGQHGRRIQYQTVARHDDSTSTDKSWEAWPFFQKPQNVMFTVKTKIPEGSAGWYNVKITGAVYNCGGEYAVYVNGEYAGNIYGYDDVSTHTVKEWELSNAIDLPEGDVEISLRAVKFYRDRESEGKGGVGSSDNNASVYLGLIELIPTSEPTISAVESTIPATIKKDSTAELSAQVKMSDGTAETYRSFGYTEAGELPTTDNVVTVTSSDPTVVEVTEVVNVEKDIPGDLTQTLDPTTVTYKLTALKAGASTITVKAIVDGKTKEITETVTVPAQRETITLNLGASNLGTDDGEGGTSYLAKGQIYRLDTLKVIDGLYEIVNPGDLQATTSGNYVSGDNVTCPNGTDTINSLMFNAGNGDSDTWNAWPEEQEKALGFTFKTKISEAQAGYYRVDITSRKYTNGGEFAIYVGGEYAGDYNSYAAVMPSAATESLNTVYIPAGDTEITLHTRKFYREKANAGIYFGNISLIPADAPSIDAVESTIPTELTEGDMSELSAKVKMTDESYRQFGYTNEGTIPTTDETVTVTSSDSSVVEVKDVVVVQKNDAKNREQILDPTKVTYKLAAKKAGSAKITVTALVDGQEKTTEQTITVTGLGTDAADDAGTVTLGILTNYEEAASGVTAAGYNVNDPSQVSVGAKVTAKANDVEGYKFMYWKVGGTTTNGGTFITTNSELKNYVVSTNTSLVAIYEKEEETLKIVEFWNANKRFLSRDDNSNGAITAPTVPSVTGFALTGNWLIGENEYLDLANIPAGTTRAVAERSDTGNEITGAITVNGEPVSEALTYDNKVERTVAGAKYWTRTIGGVDEIVAYGETYTYHMWDATAIKSHTDDIVAVPVVVLDDSEDSAYMIEYCVPEGYTKLEAGILFAKSGSPKIGSFSSKAASQSEASHGQFTAQADTDETAVRGYLVYEDKDGVKKVIYADLPAAE